MIYATRAPGGYAIIHSTRTEHVGSRNPPATIAAIRRRVVISRECVDCSAYSSIVYHNNLVVTAIRYTRLPCVIRKGDKMFVTMTESRLDVADDTTVQCDRRSRSAKSYLKNVSRKRRRAGNKSAVFGVIVVQEPAIARDADSRAASDEPRFRESRRSRDYSGLLGRDFSGTHNFAKRTRDARTPGTRARARKNANGPKDPSPGLEHVINRRLDFYGGRARGEEVAILNRLIRDAILDPGSWRAHLRGPPRRSREVERKR